MTPRKIVMKKRLDFVSQTKDAMKRRYHTVVKELRTKLNTPKRAQIGYLNQDIKRKKVSLAIKDAHIARLNRPLKRW